MKYMGSKNRIAKDILPIILKDRISEEQYYVEPFCGGCNLIDKVKGNRIASDINPYLIAMYQEISNGWIPKDNYTEQDYNNARQNKKESPYLSGYFGFALSYGGKWFGGWCRDRQGKRDYVKEAYNNMLKQIPNLKGIDFFNVNYDKLDIPNNSIIYCDIPYKDTTKYNTTFDYDNFYTWCRYMKKQGHQIFVSEYNMPDDFICVWQKEITSSLTQDTGSKKAIERLFTI
jgi:DNA adenine methylase